MVKQREITEITKQVDGEFTRIQLVENIRTSDQEYKQWGAKRKRFREMLAASLIEEGVTEATVGEDLIIIDHKSLNSFDLTDLGALDKITTEDQVRRVVKHVPSSSNSTRYPISAAPPLLLLSRAPGASLRQTLSLPGSRSQGR